MSDDAGFFAPCQLHHLIHKTPSRSGFDANLMIFRAFIIALGCDEGYLTRNT